MQDLGFTEGDWKLFRERLPIWQERYMERLIMEYEEMLKSGEPASSKFWNLEKRIKADRRKTGVLATDVRRSNMKFLMLDLINDGAITIEDFEGFSEEFKTLLEFYLERR